MGFDPSRLRRGELIVGAGSLVLLASMFLFSWYGVTLSGGSPGSRFSVSVSLDGWHGLTRVRWVLAVTIVAGLALVFLQATRQAPALPVTASVAVTFLGGISALLLIYRVLISHPGSEKAGAFIGLVATFAIAGGGYASLREEGISSRDEPREIPIVRLGDETGT
jgi:hypothetical protein